MSLNLSSKRKLFDKDLVVIKSMRHEPLSAEYKIQNFREYKARKAMSKACSFRSLHQRKMDIIQKTQSEANMNSVFSAYKRDTSVSSLSKERSKGTVSA